MFIHNLNPSIKAITIIITVLLLALVFDPITPLLFLIWTWILVLGIAKVDWKKFLLYFSPFLIFAMGMFWTNILFANQPNNLDNAVNFLGLHVPIENIFTGVSLALRVLSFASLSLLFIFTTNIVHFILSLMQQCKLPAKLAYGILAGYRFLPMMREELGLIRAAHRVRGVNRATNLKESLNQYKRFAIPLLASAIRKAERTAMAMESKGFTGSRNRTFYHRFTVTYKDWLFLIIMIGMLLSIAGLSWYLGYFQWYNGEL